MNLTSWKRRKDAVKVAENGLEKLMRREKKNTKRGKTYNTQLDTENVSPLRNANTLSKRKYMKEEVDNKNVFYRVWW